MHVERQQLELDMEQRTGSKLGKEYIKTVYCLLAYLTYMQSTSWEMPDLVKHKLDQIVRRNINHLRYADDTTLMAESEEKLKSLLMNVKQESEQVGLKFNIQKKKQKTKIMTSSPITLWYINGETMETITDFIFLGSKISVDGECSHEIKRCLLLGEKL